MGKPEKHKRLLMQRPAAYTSLNIFLPEYFSSELHPKYESDPHGHFDGDTFKISRYFCLIEAKLNYRLPVFLKDDKRVIDSIVEPVKRSIIRDMDRLESSNLLRHLRGLAREDTIRSDLSFKKRGTLDFYDASKGNCFSALLKLRSVLLSPDALREDIRPLMNLAGRICEDGRTSYITGEDIEDSLRAALKIYHSEDELLRLVRKA